LLQLPVYPMLLEKSDAVPKGPYLHSLKIDGIRCLLNYSLTGIQLATRHLTDITRQFPEIQHISLNANDAIVDGELCVVDEKTARPNFEQTMSRFHTSGQKIYNSMMSKPSVFFAFDILQLNGETLVQRKLVDRLAILQEVIQPSNHLVMLESYEDGDALFQATKEMGLEGTVSKLVDSKYLIAKRSQNGEWLKNKHFIIETVDVVGIRKKDFGWSLAQNGKYVGILELAPPHARKAFWAVAKQIIIKEDKNYYWLEPVFRINVKSIGRTSNGLLRTPSFINFVFEGATVGDS